MAAGGQGFCACLKQCNEEKKGNRMNIFYNRPERRLRAFWRIFFQGLIYLVFQLILSIGLGLGAIFGMMAGGNFTGLLDDPVLLTTQISAMMLDNPWMRIFDTMVGVIAILAALGIAAKVLDKRPFKDYGFHFNRAWWRDLGFGMGLGAVLMLFIFGLELALGWVKITSVPATNTSGAGFWFSLLVALLTFIGVAISEESFSRAYLLRNLAEGFNGRKFNPQMALWIGYLLSAVVFGLLHLSNPNTTWVSTLNLMVAGLFLGLGFILTGELALPIGLHLTWNLFQGNVFGFPVSGTQAGVSFLTIEQGGPVALTGGAFGPEAGLIGLVAMGLGCLAILWWVRRTTGTVRLADRLAQYEAPLKPAEVREAH